MTERPARVVISGRPPAGLCEALARAGAVLIPIVIPGEDQPASTEASAAELRAAGEALAGGDAGGTVCLLCGLESSQLAAAVTAAKLGASLALLAPARPGHSGAPVERIVTTLGASPIDPGVDPAEAAATLLDLLR